MRLPDQGVGWSTDSEWRQKLSPREGPNVWGCEGKPQFGDPAGSKSSPGYKGLGADGSRLFPIGPYLPGSVLCLEIELTWRGGEQGRGVKPGPQGIKELDREPLLGVCELCSSGWPAHSVAYMARLQRAAAASR